MKPQSALTTSNMAVGATASLSVDPVLRELPENRLRAFIDGFLGASLSRIFPLLDKPAALVCCFPRLVFHDKVGHRFSICLQIFSKSVGCLAHKLVHEMFFGPVLASPAATAIVF